jgi:transcriptional regulator with XRE-family HTH domain
LDQKQQLSSTTTTTTPRVATDARIGRAIRRARERVGWDQGQLAARLGVSQAWVSLFERGKKRASAELLVRAVHVLLEAATTMPIPERPRQRPERLRLLAALEQLLAAERRRDADETA